MSRESKRSKEDFAIYLTHEEITESDEYSSSDPYSVETQIDGEFHRRRFELTLELLREIGRLDYILDVGCGEGHITAAIKHAFPNSEVHAFDYSISAIRKAHATYPGITFFVADALKSPYPEREFDVVVCNNLWEHVTDPMGLLARMKGSLKPGGHVVISTPSRYRTQNLVRVLLGKPVVFMSHHHVTEYSVGQVKEQLSFGGFEVIKTQSRPISTVHWKAAIAKQALRAWCSLTGSQHELEATVFFVARAIR